MKKNFLSAKKTPTSMVFVFFKSIYSLFNFTRKNDIEDLKRYLSSAIGKVAGIKLMTVFFAWKHRSRFSLTMLFFLITVWSQATTYYSKATGNANTLPKCETNPADGTGTAPGNFTTSGDVFILRAVSGLTTTTSLWTIGNNVTLQIIGSLTTSGSVTIGGILLLDGTIAINGGNNIFMVNGTVIFTNPSATQVSLAGAGAGNNFTLGAGSTFKTVNVNGVSGANCSLPADAPLKNIQFST